MPIAFAYHRIVFDDDGHPYDYILVEVNNAFENLTGMKRKEIIGKSVTDVIPGLQTSEFDWIGTFEKVALTGEKVEFEQYLEPLQRWLSVLAYSSESQYFVTLFTDITEYRSAQETIQSQHDFLEKVKESLTHPFYVIDANDYTVTMANDASGFGLLEESSTCFSLTHRSTAPCDSIDHPCPLQEVKKRKEPVLVHHVHYDDKGNARFLEIYAYPIFDNNGTVTEIIEYAIDITERYQAEEALRESENRHRTLIQSINDMIFVINVDNRFSQFYSSNTKLLLSPPQDFLGKSVTEVLPSDVARQYLELSNTVRTTRDRQSLEYSLDIGESRFWFLATLDLHEDGESIVLVVRDITERKQVEVALRKSEASLAEAQRIAHLGNWDWDIIADELHCSDEIYKIFGVSPHDFSGSQDPFLEFVHPNDREFVKAAVDRAITKKDSQLKEHRIIRPDGSERIVQEQSKVIYDDDGNATRMIGTVLDITERNRIENKLQMASQRAMLYLDLMGHDVTNQLQIIMSCNALLEHKAGSFENGYLMEMINDAVQECRRIVSKARSTELLTDSPLVLRDLKRVVIYCINAISEDYDQVVIASEYTVNQAPILADDFLECLLDNLLENAILHNPSRNLRIWVKIQEKDHGYELSISDNGPGIENQIKKDLFNSSRRHGGMGLHQVKEILEKYKGKVEVCDRVLGTPECGAEFLVWFPKATHKLRARKEAG
jgi:PAS domain S-box-containing protein